MSILHVSTCQVHVWPRSLSITEPKLLLESILRPTLLSNISDVGCPFEHHCSSLCFNRSSQVFHLWPDTFPPPSGFASCSLSQA